MKSWKRLFGWNGPSDDEISDSTAECTCECDCKAEAQVRFVAGVAAGTAGAVKQVDHAIDLLYTEFKPQMGKKEWRGFRTAMERLDPVLHRLSESGKSLSQPQPQTPYWRATLSSSDHGPFGGSWSHDWDSHG